MFFKITKYCVMKIFVVGNIFTKYRLKNHDVLFCFCMIVIEQMDQQYFDFVLQCDEPKHKHVLIFNEFVCIFNKIILFDGISVTPWHGFNHEHTRHLSHHVE